VEIDDRRHTTNVRWPSRSKKVGQFAVLKPARIAKRRQYLEAASLRVIALASAQRVLYGQCG
jgi:hypothetical protein